MSYKMLCPKCKGYKFTRKTIAEVTIYGDGSGFTDDIDYEDTESYRCIGCDKEIVEEELIKGVEEE